MTSRELLELSDLIVDYDVDTLRAREVRQAEVVERLQRNGQRWAARYARALPATNGVLDRAHCEQVLLRAHTELQRLNEEFLQAERMRLILRPVLEALRAAGTPGPLRVVDVGGGLGYMVRSLAAHGRLGRDVELIGCDMNPTLIGAAKALTDAESLWCDFRLANAFTLAEPAHVFISTGVVHHFRGAALDAFFAAQRHAAAFIHFDMQASPLSGLGSWVFHQSRMREPLARHDGVVSARRAHTTATLLAAARGATALTCAGVDEWRSLWSVVVRPMHAVLGARAALWAGVVERLGDQAGRLGATS
jgi:2-polyprenyl-3-methyl-5-hydroxy-6-metoxy-1,4-benzoquinol methylase